MAENEGSNLKLGVQSFPGNILLSERRPERGEGEATRSLGKEHPRQREWQVQRPGDRSRPGELTVW